MERNRKKIKWFALPLVLILCFTLLVGCSKPETAVSKTVLASETSTNLNPEKEITHITSGVIKADSLIAVRFKEDQVTEKALNNPIRNLEVFQFEPEISGKYYWEDERTLVFRPANPLLEANKYTAALDLQALFPDIEEVEPVKKFFDFETLGQDVLHFEGDFELLSEEDTSETYFVGQFTLAETADLDVVRKAVHLTHNGVEYAVEVNTEDNKTFEMVSESIYRDEKDRMFEVKIYNKELHLNETFQKEYLLSSMHTLQVTRIEEEREGDSSNICIYFSDELDPTLNYTGYIQLRPVTNYQLEVQGNLLVLKGDFTPGQKYQLKLLSGIRSRLGKELATTQDFDLDIKISDIKPRVEFANSGMFLTTMKDKRIAFRSMNVERLHITVKKVPEENLISFFEENSYRVYDGSFENYERYNFMQVGEVIDSRIVYIGQEKNKWIQSELDLSNVIKDSQSDLYIVQLEFGEDDVLYMPDWSYWQIRDYVRNSGRKAKHLILSDIGITAKRSDEGIHVFVTDVLKAKPIQDAVVILKDRYNKVQERAYTDEEGMCLLEHEGDYIEVRKRDQFSILKFNETQLGMSLFEVDGIDNSSGIRAFIYMDRGVYRPGETINLSVIARNDEGTFPTDHPVSLKVYNPKGKLVVEQTDREAKDGFYHFQFDTEVTALTGDWWVEVNVGTETFSQILKIEEIVPYRIKVNIEPEKEMLSQEDEMVEFTIASQYLFGTPAEGLESQTRIKVEPFEQGFSRFKNFTFSAETKGFNEVESYEIVEDLDENGEARISWNLPQIDNVPSAVRVKIDSKVLEKGGRPVPAVKYIPVQVYDRYVGIQRFENNYLQMGDQATFNMVLVSQDGELIADQELRYRIYKMRRYWWWDYDNRDSFRRHYKSDSETVLVDQGTLMSKDGVVSLEHNLDDYGEMLIQVEDVNGGHTASYFFRSYWWGWGEAGESADIVNIKTDQEKYNVGDIAKVLLNTPEKGNVLVTVEKGGEILYKAWQEIESANTEISIPVDETFIPNAYVSAAVYQPYGEVTNDRPIRMYGVVPLFVEKADTHLNFNVSVPEKVQPGQEFTIEIDSKKQAQFTVAVVDEGLLDITRFQTPNPWKYFFQKERLNIRSYDTLEEVIGLNWGYMHHVFSIGGEIMYDEARYEKKQTQSVKANRFKPVAMFAGPIETDESGKAKVTFTMPEYIGQVRVMVIGAAGESYGHREEEIPVKLPLMVMPTFPRVLGPEDEILVPVTVFTTEDHVGTVEVKLELEGPLEAVGSAVETLDFPTQSSEDLFFKLRAKPNIGKAKIRVSAKSVEYQAEKNIEIAVRPYNPYTYLAEEKVLKEGEEATFTIPERGIENSSVARISVASRKGLNLNHRFKWLIRYPYGCIEQTTSSVFPQLYMKDVFKLDGADQDKIDENINAAIDRLRSFQLSNGGFSYWPNGDSVSDWGTNYAGHFLIEAKKRGYYVPAEMLERWFKYQHSVARDASYGTLTAAYRLYLLALGGEKNLVAMNYFRESRLDEFSTTAKYYMVAAYEIAGYEEIANEILTDLTTEVGEVDAFDGTFGSSLRNKTIMLEVLTLMERYDEGLALYNEIADDLATMRWYSTQTTAYSLLGLGKYIQGTIQQGSGLEGKVILSDQEVPFKSQDIVTRIPLEDSYGQEVKVINDSDKSIFVTMEWEGIPLRDGIEDSAKNLALSVEWLDEKGNIIDPDEIAQGTTFWGHFQVTNTSDDKHIDEIALVQVLPSGWEIENTRLLGEELPRWMNNNFRLNREEYLDIRDDRVMWFFDMSYYRSTYDFVVKLNAVTVGEFYLPPTMVEAMYNNNYKATVAGKKVKVIQR